MPAKLPRACGISTCGQPAVRGGRCPAHTRDQQQHYSRFQTGQTSYKTARWLRARAAFLSRQENALCVDCRADGRTTAANTVDHIVPHRGDPALMYDEKNWAARCASCHSKRTAQQTWGGTRSLRPRAGGVHASPVANPQERSRLEARAASESNQEGDRCRA